MANYTQFKMPKEFIKGLDVVPPFNAINQAKHEVFQILWGEESDRNLLTDRQDVFLLAEDGTFDAYKKLNPAALTHSALSNRLFIRDKENNLRQLQLSQENGEYTLKISEPVTVTEPTPPAFWKYLLYPFFAGQIREYNQHKEFNESYRAFAATELKRNGPAVTEAEPKAEKPQDEKPNIQQKKQKTISQMTLDEFTDYLENAPMINYSLHVQQALTKPGATVDDYYDALTTILVAHATDDLLNQTKKMSNTSRQNFLAEKQKHFDTLVTDLRKFVPTMVDQELMNDIFSVGFVNSPRGYDLTKQTLYIQQNGLNAYYESIKPEEPTNQTQQVQPKQPKQVQQQQINNPQI